MAEDPFEELAARLDGLSDAPERVAEKAAPAVLSVAQDGWAAGKAPSGEAWPALKRRSGVPLTVLTELAVAHADGATVVITLPDELQYHQEGTDHFPRRQVVPDEGEEPAEWVAAVDGAADEVLGDLSE